MLRLRRHVFRVRGAGVRKMGNDKVNDHQSAGAEYIVSADMSCIMHQKGCAERLGLRSSSFISRKSSTEAGAHEDAVDHAEGRRNSSRRQGPFDFHDKRLWDLREKRDRASEHFPEWEELRSLASAIKEHR